MLAGNSRSIWQLAYKMLGDGDQAGSCFKHAFVRTLQLSKSCPLRSAAAELAFSAVSYSLERLCARVSHENLADPLDVEVISAEASAQDASLVEEQLANRLRRTLTDISAHEAQVFCLHRFGGLGHHQLGRLLGIKPKACAILAERADKKLSVALELGHSCGKDNLLRAVELISAEAAQTSPGKSLVSSTQKLLEEADRDRQGYLVRPARKKEWAVYVTVAFVGAFVMSYMTYFPPEQPGLVEPVSQSEQPEPEPEPDEPEQPAEEPERAELPTQKIDRLFTEGRYEELLLLARGGSLEDQQALAAYLGRMENERAFVLLTLLAKLHADDEHNPFENVLETEVSYSSLEPLPGEPGEVPDED